MKRIIVFMILIICVISYNCTYASFADFSDEDAKEQSEKLIQEQKQNFDTTKSSNNYLNNIKIEKYEITPNFEKQTINYEIKEEVTVDEIKIEVEKDDSKASVLGDGIIKLNSGENNIRIDVSAESGTVRSYFIRVVKSTKKELKLNSMKLEGKANDNNITTIDFTPEFNSEIYLYNCNIASYIDKIDIEAQPSDEKTKIEISGNENLKEGQNEILVTIKNDNNEKVIYKINVNKEKKSESNVTNKEENNKKIFILLFLIIFIIIVLVIKKKK